MSGRHGSGSADAARPGGAPIAGAPALVLPCGLAARSPGRASSRPAMTCPAAGHTRWGGRVRSPSSTAMTSRGAGRPQGAGGSATRSCRAGRAGREVPMGDAALLLHEAERVAAARWAATDPDGDQWPGVSRRLAERRRRQAALLAQAEAVAAARAAAIDAGVAASTGRRRAPRRAPARCLVGGSPVRPPLSPGGRGRAAGALPALRQRPALAARRRPGGPRGARLRLRARAAARGGPGRRADPAGRGGRVRARGRGVAGMTARGAPTRDGCAHADCLGEKKRTAWAP